MPSAREKRKSSLMEALNVLEGQGSTEVSSQSRKIIERQEGKELGCLCLLDQKEGGNDAINTGILNWNCIGFGKMKFDNKIRNCK